MRALRHQALSLQPRAESHGRGDGEERGVSEGVDAGCGCNLASPPVVAVSHPVSTLRCSQI